MIVTTMKKLSFFSFLFLAVVGILSSCGSKGSSDKETSIDGTYVYVDDISRSIVTISGDTWQMKTQFGAPGYYGSDAKYDSGKVKGNVLYYSGLFQYGEEIGRASCRERVSVGV